MINNWFHSILHTVIVQKGQGIYGFFDVVFGFMYKRTDFFYEMAPGENMGFFPGNAEAIVYSYFRKYQNIHFKERVPKRNIDMKEVEEHIKKQKEGKTDTKKQENEISNTEIKKEEQTKTNSSINEQSKTIEKNQQPSEKDFKPQTESKQSLKDLEKKYCYKTRIFINFYI